MMSSSTASAFSGGFVHSYTNRRVSLSSSRRQMIACSSGGGGGNNINIHGSGGGGGGGDGSGGDKNWYLIRVSKDVEAQIEAQLGKENIFDIRAGIRTTERSSESSIDILQSWNSSMSGFILIYITLTFAFIGLRDLVEVSQDYLADLRKRDPNNKVSQDYSADLKRRDPSKSRI